MKLMTILYLVIQILLMLVASCLHRPAPVHPGPQCLAIERGYGVEYVGDCPQQQGGRERESAGQ